MRWRGSRARGAIALILLAAAMAASPGGASMIDPPAAAAPERPPGSAGLICMWAIYATMAEVGKRCGVARNAPVEAELESSALRMGDYARRQSPEGAAMMAGYRARHIEGEARICVPDGLTMYRQMIQARPEAVRGAADRLLASSPPVEWGTCL